jgi:hypothetical protein
MAFLTGYASISRRAMTGTIPVVARSHPLAKGLLAAFYPAAFPGSTMTNLAVPGLLDLTVRRNANSYNVNTPEGPGLNGILGQANTSGLPANFVANPPTGAVSLFIRGKWGPINTGTAPAQMFGFYINTTNFLQLALLAAPDQPAPSDSVIGVAYPTNTTTTALPAGTTVPVVGSMVSAGASFVSGALPSLYVNGIQQVLQGSPSVMVSPLANWNANGQFTLQEFQSSTRTGSMVATVAYAWGNRFLTAGEHAYLNANPYSLLRWPIDVVYDVLEQPASTPPTGTATSKAMILAPLTVGLGGVATAERWLRQRKDAIRRLRGE